MDSTSKKLVIKELSGGASLNTQGDVLYEALLPLLEKGERWSWTSPIS